MRKYTVRSRKFFRSYLEALFLTLFVGLTLRFFVISPYKIPTSSMAPALLSGDYIFVFKLPYGIRLPFMEKFGEVQNLERGDIVLFSYSQDLSTKFIKRVVGLPGDKIEYKNRKLILNGEELKYEQSLLSFPDIKRAEDLQFLVESLPMSGADHKSVQVIYNSEQDPEELTPILVPPGEVFLLGDHRDNSDDSRYWGMVPKRNLDGRALFIWLSRDPDTHTIRWNRILNPL